MWSMTADSAKDGDAEQFDVAVNGCVHIILTNPDSYK